MFNVPNKYRVKVGSHGSQDDIGNNGLFHFGEKFNNKLVRFRVIASDGGDWEHVSVTLRNVGGPDRLPTWTEMCFVKDIFWDKSDCVVQYHPPETDYVNYSPYCLHMWRPINQECPRPPSILVGPIGEVKA